MICWPSLRRVMISWPPRFFVMYLSGWVVARLATVWSCCWYSRMVENRKGRFPLSSNTGCSRRHSARSGVDVRIEWGGSGCPVVYVSAGSCWTEVWSVAGSCETRVGLWGRGMPCHCMAMRISGKSTEGVREDVRSTGFEKEYWFEFFKLKSPT